ncbi:hypothetical protein SAMN05660690_3147 [Geodermatophilus telluris]|uniref:Uncharacterized protein n=1 Tax=Geodermatophilus telluris TaxID=1190417 RepID=A0A1G6QXG5_9ACTN|nr:hypothetical protein [Geodermatophilus telluris]SDC97060.1 hypothetical protein SAMN05660690_3147 [Geodermatophilus telluris]
MALLVTGGGNSTWLRLAVYCALALGLQLGHALLVIRTARRGARLHAGHGAWKARYREGRHLWSVLTFTMPLRAHDSFWVALVAVLGLVYPLAVLVREVDGSPGPSSFVRQWAMFGAFTVVLFLTAVALSLLERATPQLTLARWASNEVRLEKAPRHARQPVGPRVAPFLEIHARRRLKRLPSSLKERYVATCDKLIETSKIGYMQQNTRQAVHRVMRDALQYSARVANSLDASEAERVANAWLVERGLADISPTSLSSRRRFPTVQYVGEVTDTVKGVLALIGAIALVVIFVINGAGLDEIISQLK